MSTLPKIERLSGARTVCTVSFPPDHVAKHEREALERLGKEVKIPGFRPGKASLEMLREHVNADRLFDETIRSLLPETFQSLLKEQNIQPIIHPKVEVQARDPLTLKITFVGRPEVKLKGIDKIKIEKKEPKFDDKDVLKMERFLIEQHRTYTDADRPAKSGDRVRLDFHGTDSEGKEIEGTRSQGYGVILGSKTLIPGFEEELIGLRSGDKKSFTVTFPDKYHAEELKGKPATFHVEILRVQDVQTPVLTDEFAKKQFGIESAAKLREQIREKMKNEEEMIERQRREQQLLDRIRDATTVEIAPELVEEEEQVLLQELDEQLKKQGLTAEQWFKQSKKDPVELRTEMKDRAEKRIRLRLGLQKLVEERGVRLTDDDMQKVTQEFLATVPEDQRLSVAPRLQKGQDLYERLKWQREVEGTIGHMLAS